MQGNAVAAGEVPTYASRQLLACVANKCAVCAHCLTMGEGLVATNQRPERCLTLVGRTPPVAAERYPLREGETVLTVGDGNLSFSRSLAEATGLGARLVASCYESRDRLRAAYPDLRENEKALRKAGAAVLHGVDATRLADAEALAGRVFDRVVWNFPCVAGQRDGADGQNEDMEANKQLLRAFFESARPFLSPRGEVHITHKSKPPFGQWGLPDIARDCGFLELGRLVFSRSTLPGYLPRKVFDSAGFPTWDARVHVFADARRAAPDAEAGAADQQHTLPQPGTVEDTFEAAARAPAVADAADAPAEGAAAPALPGGSGSTAATTLPQPRTREVHVRRGRRKRARDGAATGGPALAEADLHSALLDLDRVRWVGVGEGFALVTADLARRVCGLFKVDAEVTTLAAAFRRKQRVKGAAERPALHLTDAAAALRKRAKKATGAGAGRAGGGEDSGDDDEDGGTGRGGADPASTGAAGSRQPPRTRQNLFSALHQSDSEDSASGSDAESGGGGGRGEGAQDA